jgi:NAD(P)-dependent dehydrogenase (short-subunit alcohol dehydrogenase family)
VTGASTLLLSGKTAVVTGATKGIGRAIAARLVEDGATVIATGTSPEGRGPTGTRYVAVDFSVEDATDRFVQELGGWAVDILINNAGINRIAPFAEIALADFDRIHAVNLRATFRLCQAVIPGMRRRGGGRIVNISSIFGLIGRTQRAAYAASKFGLDGMTTALAAEVAADGILANCVAPGFIDSELTRRILGEDGIAELVEQVPMKRLGRPEEVAELVVWLAGPLNTFVSGQMVVIDGGFSRV